MDGNDVRDNRGVGLWCIACRDAFISNNTFALNAGSGVLMQASRGTGLSGNRIWNNGWGGANEAGVYLSGSTHTRVVDNTIAFNKAGVLVRPTSSRRTAVLSCEPPIDQFQDRPVENQVIGNTVIGRGRAPAIEFANDPGGKENSFVCESNRSEGNRIFPAAKTSPRELALSEVERDGALRAAGIPSGF